MKFGFVAQLVLVSFRLVAGGILRPASVPAAAADDVAGPVYTAFDDASWAITSSHLSNQLGDDKQARYDEYIEGCDLAVVEKGLKRPAHYCSTEDAHRIKMNSLQPSSVYNYTKFGYQKIKAPKELFDLIREFWQKNRGKAVVEWNQINTYHNMWDAPPAIVHMNQAHTGGSPALQSKIWDLTREVLEAWTGQLLSPVSLYGIRLYHEGSILAPHVDRMPLVTSCIINVDQDVDEPWPLEVYGHDGKAVNVTMEPGDMVLYESHSVIHGRPFPMKGNFYANVFVHFEPIEPYPGVDPAINQAKDIPPYIVPGSQWEFEWKRSNDGWNAKYSNPHDAAKKGDVRVLKRIAQVDSTALHLVDKGGWQPLHEAVRAGHHEAVELILLNGGNFDHVTPQGYSPLNLARQFLSEDHPVTQLLIDVGAKDVGPEL